MDCIHGDETLKNCVCACPRCWDGTKCICPVCTHEYRNLSKPNSH